jgi:nitrogen regulatory protein PII
MSNLMGKEKINLPFEVTYSERPSKKSKNMKRLAVLLKPENVDSIIAEVRGMGLEATIYDVKGATKEKERVTSGRGMGTIELAYTTRKVVATVVNADDLEDVVGKMKKALGGGSGAVVVVSAVDDLIRL